MSQNKLTVKFPFETGYRSGCCKEFQVLIIQSEKMTTTSRNSVGLVLFDRITSSLYADRVKKTPGSTNT